MIRVIPILALLVVLCGCKKTTGIFEIKGTVTNMSDETALPDTKLYLWSFAVGSGETTLMDSITTDINGTYSFIFERGQMEKYEVTFNKEGYFESRETIYFSQLSLDEANILNLNTYGKSWVGIKIKNLSPEAGDHFRFIKQDGKTDCSTCCPSIEQNFFGPLDTVIYCPNNANDTYSVLYWIVGTPTVDLVAATTLFSDTSLIEINY